MHAAFGIVLFVVVALGVLVAVVTFVGRSGLYDQIGKGGLSMDRLVVETETPAAVREEEIRQMLEAQNARRERQGQPPLDVEAEISRLTSQQQQIDPALREEIRQLVVARNARRARQGKPPLDVEAEIERQIAELGEER
jgi:hypothetical protein